jgi:4-carboxymuconolactone decarboxylase
MSPDDQSPPAAPDAADHRAHPAAGISPYLVDLTDRVLFGDIWERPGLSKRDRSLVTMAVLMKEFRVDELRSHIRRGLANGVTRDEIAELIVHLAFYGGWPVAANGVSQVKAVYDELDAS